MRSGSMRRQAVRPAVRRGAGGRRCVVAYQAFEAPAPYRLEDGRAFKYIFCGLCSNVD